MAEQTEQYNVLYIQGVTRLGGSIESLLGLLRRIDKRLFRPVVLTSADGVFATLATEAGALVRIVPMGMWRKARDLWIRPFRLWAIKRLIQRERIHLVHANTYWDLPYAIIPAGMIGIPSVCHLRNTITSDKIGKYLFKRAAKIVTVSDAVGQAFDHWPDKRDKIVTIYNGVDLGVFTLNRDLKNVRAEFGIDSSDTLLGVIGRIDSTKGQNIFIQSMEILKRRNLHLKALIVGITSKREKWLISDLKRLCREAGLSNDIIFTGLRRDIPDIVAAVDCCIVPSLPTANEGFGRVLIESMAMAKPVIATSVDGFPEVVVDGQTGIIVPPGDPQALAKAIDRLVHDQQLRQDMGEKGLTRVHQHFSLDAQVRKIERLYFDILTKRP